MAKIEELQPLLTAPAEALNVEYKTWLDLKGNDEHKADLAKAAIAIANEGGGYIVIGMHEERPNLMSETRPPRTSPHTNRIWSTRSFGASPRRSSTALLRHCGTQKRGMSMPLSECRLGDLYRLGGATLLKQ